MYQTETRMVPWYRPAIETFAAEPAKELAKQWRKERGYQGKGGVVIVYAGEVQGWMNELRDPQSWRPGCIAVNESGGCWESVGGNDLDGAERWELL